MPNKTGDFLPLQLTNAGRDMLTQGRAGHVLTFTKVAIGDGTATGTAVDNLTALKGHKLYIPIAKNETVHAGQMRLQFRVNNKVVTSGFYFREIGLIAKVDNGEEKLYAYTTCGDKARMIYDNTYPIQERVVNIDTVTDNAPNVRVILDWSIVYATQKDIIDMIKPHKELSELDHPDESVTTRKLRDKSVTLPKLADDVNDLLQKTYVKKSGDTMTGNLKLNNSSISFNNGTNNTYDTKIRVASNGNFDIGVTEDSTNKNATSQLLLHSQNKPKWYNSSNGGKNLVVVNDYNTYTTDIWHTKPELTPLINWDQMKKDNNNVDTRNITVQHTGGKETAYGGDLDSLMIKYKSPGRGTLVLKESYKNYDAILIRMCNDDGFSYQPKIISTWLLDYMFNSCPDVCLFHPYIGWHLLPFTKPPEYGANVNPSTELVWQCWWQNCAIIEIYGVKYKRYGNNDMT